MVEGTRHHGKPSVGLLIERPETEVIAIEICAQGKCGLREQVSRDGAFRRQKIIVDAPCRPDESIKNVRRRGNNVFLEPKVAAFVGECNAALDGCFEEGVEGPLCSYEICVGASFAIGANQQRNSLALSKRGVPRSS